MNVVGNCPQCGNPIYASSPDDVRRTCVCALTMRPVTIPTQPPTYVPLQPYYPPTTYPIQPGQWWCSDPTITTGNTTVSYVTPVTPKPPDEDAGMVRAK